MHCVYYIPGLPLPVPCSVPDTPNGHHTFNGGEVPRGATIGHAEVVRLVCEAGHSIVGSDTLRCWYGQWTVTGARPSCTPGICCSLLVHYRQNTTFHTVATTVLYHNYHLMPSLPSAPHFNYSNLNTTFPLPPLRPMPTARGKEWKLHQWPRDVGNPGAWRHSPLHL